MRTVITNARLSFPDLFEAKSFNGSDPKFGATFILKSDDKQIAALKSAMLETAKEKWGAKGESTLRTLIAQKKTFLHDGTEKDLDGFGEGTMYFAASSKKRPLVIDRDKSPLAESDGKPYAGCYVNASIEVWAMDNTFGKRICASLNGVQFAHDGEAFGGGTSCENDFQALPDDFDKSEEAMAEFL